MNQITRNRVLAGRLVLVALALCGVAVGCLLGCAIALLETGNALEASAQAATAHENAALAEARAALHAMQSMGSGYCSNAEIASFRLMVFGSEYLKDAGRIRDDRVDCSAASGHPARAIGPFKPDLRLEDGAIAYGHLTLAPNSGLRRTALRLGSDYVVFDTQPALGPARVSTSLAFTMQAPQSPPAGAASATTPSGVPPYMRRDGRGQRGDTLYATRCSDPAFSCVTATATVSEALRGESGVLSVFTVTGGIAGILCGLGLPILFSGNRDMGRQLRRDLERGKLEVRYQPIVNLETRMIVGGEALARWTDDRGNPVDPEVFVKVAEEQGFIGYITRTVLNRVLHDFAATLRSRPDFRISINVGAPDLLEPKFLPMLEGALRKAKVRPESVVVEITERSAANGEAAKETIRLLRQFGHSIHIDDFGSGFSNLDKLLYLYADTIKIDKAFTRTIDTESVAAVLLPHIMTIAKSLNLDVIVEGVEIPRQADYFLPGRQKIYGQGWLFGRPMTAEAFLSQLALSMPVQEDDDADPVLDSRPGTLRAVPPLTV